MRRCSHRVGFWPTDGYVINVGKFHFIVMESYMKKTQSILATITLSLFASWASADAYMGANYALIDADGIDLAAIVVKGGVQLNEWAAVEARAGFGVQDDSYLGVDVELNYLVGGYFIAGIPNDSGFYPYAIAGYTQAEAEASGYGLSEQESDTDVSYGAGINYGFTETLAGNLEFMRYADSDFDAISFGVSFKF